MKDFSISPKELRAKQEAALAERPIMDVAIANAQKAAKEPSFSGWLRRQIHARPQMFAKLPEAAGISRDQVAAFLEGEGRLTTAKPTRSAMLWKSSLPGLRGSPDCG